MELIPVKLFIKAKNLTEGIDIDDTEFVAMTEHVRGKLWTGDKELIKGLKKKSWNRTLSTDELYKLLVKRL